MSEQPVVQPGSMLPIEGFQAHLAEALEECRRSLQPISVLLLRVEPHPETGPRPDEPFMRRIGEQVVTNFRAQPSPGFPARELDAVAWWEGDFIALCPNTGAKEAQIPASRLIARIERILPSESGGEIKVRVAVWTWDWSASNKSELSIMRQLREALERQDAELEEVSGPVPALQHKLAMILDQLDS